MVGLCCWGKLFGKKFPPNPFQNFLSMGKVRLFKLGGNCLGKNFLKEVFPKPFSRTLREKYGGKAGYAPAYP
jgi:hypothetical protein